MPIFDPTDRELEKLRQAVAKSAKQVGNTVGLLPRPDPGSPSPAHYVALTPSGGIAPMRGLVPGNADCLIYQLTPIGLQHCGFVTSVNNFFRIGVSGFQPILISQDKFGDWWVSGYYDPDLMGEEDTGTGTGGEIGPGTGTGPDDEDCHNIPGIDSSELPITNTPDYVLGYLNGCLVRVPVTTC